MNWTAKQIANKVFQLDLDAEGKSYLTSQAYDIAVKEHIQKVNSWYDLAARNGTLEQVQNLLFMMRMKAIKGRDYPIV